jgi:hypothetical protein
MNMDKRFNLSDHTPKTHDDLMEKRLMMIQKYGDMRWR